MDVVKKIYHYAEPNLTLVGWMGFVGFPVYYYIWAFMFPQPYESMLLRGFCAVVLLVLALRDYIPSYLQKYLPYYYVATITFCLPFFFMFMLLMNDWSTVWVMSLMACIFLHVLLVHESKVLFLQTILSIIAAALTTWTIKGEITYNMVMWPYIPIFLFTYVFGNLFYFRNQAEHESKVSIAKAFGAGIAHEMRNPLSALKTSVDVIQSTLPNGHDRSSDSYTISAKDLEVVTELLEGADEVIRNGNEAIDLLLTSIDKNRVSNSTFTRHSIQQVIEDTLNSYPYKSKSAKNVVSLKVVDNFEYFGSDLLLKYSLYNLMKNAFYYQNDSDFQITITLYEDEWHNRLVFKDNGIGIDEDSLDQIFNDFYTHGKNGSYGLGLPFCKKVMNSFGGNIECRSELEQWTEFTLTFPKYQSREVQSIKLDLMSARSVLYMGESKPIIRKFNEHAFYQGFTFKAISPEQALGLEEYEFEYDLLLLDLDSFNDNAFSVMESKLGFTVGKLAYLYDENKHYSGNWNRFLEIYPTSKQNVLEDVGKVLDGLIFDAHHAHRGDIPSREVSYNKTILLADDNVSLRSLTSILLSKQGYHVVEVSDGAEAIDTLENSDIDLVILDIDMPVKDGYTAATDIRNSSKSFASIPIIGHTGDSSPESIEKMHLVGMNDYLIKPVSKDNLLETLENYL
ncbi:hybrid sensor histidine kinase/response regulator [Vibrio sp. SCSIO 43135]|nr:hybrid sensor histidine kinase/response regulator [Vibrio sp. SCSIO 43135]USD43995.1 hybrid sensor histidine kinase/response regulator [Vibrio sp. SCSIO 43135]